MKWRFRGRVDSPQKLSLALSSRDLPSMMFAGLSAIGSGTCWLPPRSEKRSMGANQGPIWEFRGLNSINLNEGRVDGRSECLDTQDRSWWS
jgi:hypothetical protein